MTSSCNFGETGMVMDDGARGSFLGNKLGPIPKTLVATPLILCNPLRGESASDATEATEKAAQYRA